MCTNIVPPAAAAPLRGTAGVSVLVYGGELMTFVVLQCVVPPECGGLRVVPVVLQPVLVRGVRQPEPGVAGGVGAAVVGSQLDQQLPCPNRCQLRYFL